MAAVALALALRRCGFMNHIAALNLIVRKTNRTTTMKNNVKVMVGQTWVNNEIEHVVAELHREFVVWANGMGESATVSIRKMFTFKPANDLEWLAVNEDEWDCSESNWSIYKSEDGEIGYCNLNIDDSYTRAQWKAMRIHLGLDTLEMNDDIANEDGVSQKGYRHAAEDIVRHFVKSCLNNEGDINETEIMWSLTEVEGHIHEYFGGDRTIVKPVYTQAMCDAGELPPVGVRCEICYDVDGLFFNGSVIAYFNDKAWLDMEGKHPVCFVKDTVFRPIDTRTDQEKLIDEVAKSLVDSYKKSFNDRAKILIDEFNITRKETSNDN